MVRKDGMWRDTSGAVRIPPDATQLQLRLCITEHCGGGGHRGAATTLSIIKDYFIWDKLETEVRSFVNTCLHCLATAGARRMPRPLTHALQVENPNELIHFDYLFLGPSSSGTK